MLQACPISVERIYPEITQNLPQASRPISFICVKYCDEFTHNILTSECINDDLNEFIVVDNRENIFFQTLGQAINTGIEQARHDLLVIVHEDVVLLPGWQAMFECSLTALEQHDPDWQVLGVVGWDGQGRKIGHYGDPKNCINTFADVHFLPAARIDEQVIVLRKSARFFPDPNLPNIHNIGRDLLKSATQQGTLSYVINAPSIHKYANVSGELVQGPEDSEKIQNRQSLTYIHNKTCSDEYLENKWKVPVKCVDALPEQALSDQQTRQLHSPIILLGRGGGGTRLMSELASDIRLFIGNNNKRAGDCLEMVGAIYRSVYRKYACPNEWQQTLSVPDLRDSAIDMLNKGASSDRWPECWGFKLPESLLILPELQAAFPNAKYVFLNRDPLATVLRRTHMTARLDNEIGRTALPLAYDVVNLPRETILNDNATVRMARSTAHQVGLVMDFKSAMDESLWHTLSFERLIAGAQDVLTDFAAFCDQTVVSEHTFESIDPKRAHSSNDQFTAETVTAVKAILAPVRQAMGYLPK